MNVKEIILDHMEKNKFDGLYAPGECACKNDDLVPCNEDFSRCLPGVLTPCDCGEHSFHIGPKVEKE